MDPARFCSQSRLVIVAGKGGVGKTTVTAALAVMAARAGLRTLIIEVEGKTGLGAAVDVTQEMLDTPDVTAALEQAGGRFPEAVATGRRAMS